MIRVKWKVFCIHWNIVTLGCKNEFGEWELTKLRVNPRFFDKTGDTSYSSKELRIDGQTQHKPVITPIIAMDNKEIRQSDNIAQAATGLN